MGCALDIDIEMQQQERDFDTGFQTQKTVEIICEHNS